MLTTQVNNTIKAYENLSLEESLEKLQEDIERKAGKYLSKINRLSPYSINPFNATKENPDHRIDPKEYLIRKYGIKHPKDGIYLKINRDSLTAAGAVALEFLRDIWDKNKSIADTIDYFKRYQKGDSIVIPIEDIEKLTNTPKKQFEDILAEYNESTVDAREDILFNSFETQLLDLLQTKLTLNNIPGLQKEGKDEKELELVKLDYIKFITPKFKIKHINIDELYESIEAIKHLI